MRKCAGHTSHGWPEILVPRVVVVKLKVIEIHKNPADQPRRNLMYLMYLYYQNQEWEFDADWSVRLRLNAGAKTTHLSMFFRIASG